jgi:hypothetical protein
MAEAASGGTAIADMDRPHGAGGPAKDRRVRAYLAVARQGVVGGHGPDSQVTVGDPYRVEAADMPQADHDRRPDQPLLEQDHQ